jgi:L-asparaginase II
VLIFIVAQMRSSHHCAVERSSIIAPSSAQASLQRQALKLHCDVKRSSFIALSSTQASLRPQALKKLQCTVKCSSFLAPSCAQASSRRGVLHFQAVMQSAFAFPTSSLYCTPLRTFEFQLTSASWFIGLFLVRSITYPSPFGRINLRRMLAAWHIFKDI